MRENEPESDSTGLNSEGLKTPLINYGFTRLKSALTAHKRQLRLTNWPTGDAGGKAL